MYSRFFYNLRPIHSVSVNQVKANYCRKQHQTIHVSSSQKSSGSNLQNRGNCETGRLVYHQKCWDFRTFDLCYGRWQLYIIGNKWRSYWNKVCNSCAQIWIKSNQKYIKVSWSDLHNHPIVGLLSSFLLSQRSPHNPEFFKDPHVFNPGRWISQDGRYVS